MYLEGTLAVRDYLAHHTQEAPRFLERFAAAGMNAHVGHDLAVGVVQICTELGMEPGDPQHHDYNGVSAILQTTEERVKRWLLTGAVKERTTELAGRAMLLPLP